MSAPSVHESPLAALPNNNPGGASSTAVRKTPTMNAKTIHILTETVLVLAAADLLLELVNSQSWAVLVLGLAAFAWLKCRRP